MTAATAALKVRLPGLTGNISLSFVVLLAALVDLSLGEVCLLAGVGSLARSGVRPVRAAFNVASLVLASGLTFGVVRGLAGDWPLAGQLGAAATMLLVSTMLCLVGRLQFGAVWRRSELASPPVQ